MITYPGHMVSTLARTSLPLSMALALSGCASAAGQPSLAPEDPTGESQPEPATEAPAPAPAIPNSAEALAERLDRITAIEISDGDNVIAKLTEAQLSAVTAELATAGVGGISATSPPWPGYSVLVHVQDRPEPFVATVVALGSLRLNAREPYALKIADAQGSLDADNIAELGPCNAMWDLMTALVGPTASKEYQRRPVPPL